MLPSLYLPMAVNCCVLPGATLATPGVTCRELREGLAGGGGVLEPPPLDDAPPEPQAVNTTLTTKIIRVCITFVMGLSLTCRVGASYVGISHFQPPRHYVSHTIYNHCGGMYTVCDTSRGVLCAPGPKLASRRGLWVSSRCWRLRRGRA